MATAVASDTPIGFDDRNIHWFELGEFEHFKAAIFDFDEDRRVFDLAAKFEPNKQIFLHRHATLTNTFVLQGEHRLYEPNGALKEVRPCGTYTSSLPGEPHREGGGDDGAVVFYSIRAGAGDEVLFEVMDDALNVTATLTVSDFLEAFAEQQKALAEGLG
ncbi:MAG: regulator [Myxococcales bacterium]|nr:regulator [Myxococcales bacterium]